MDARRLHDSLVYRFGRRQVFMDLSGIEAGEDFVDQIAEEIGKADVLLCLVDPLWAAPDETGRFRLHEDGDYVRMEVELALQRSITVIPVLIRNALMPSHDELPASIALFARRQLFELSEERWHADAARLVARLERIETARRRSVPVALQEGVVPPDTRRLTRTFGTSFVGRVNELAELPDALETARLVTIVGPGGVGKTRLALETARRAESNFPDGVFLAELAALADGSLIVPTVAGALDIRSAPGVQVTLDLLIERIKDRQLLLVLDNCEHLIESVSGLMDALVHRCPGLRVLATSRQALEVAGERLFRLSPLDAPRTMTEIAAAELLTFPAVQLFVDRAGDVSPSFTLDDRTAPPVGRIVELLDGLPLAIELAAARLGLLSVDDLLAALVDRFDPFAAGRRGGEPRHRTLWAMVDWSYELLGVGERLLFERLSVFTGDFPMSAAESVCGADLPVGAVRSGLLRLVAHSLVQRAEVNAGHSRFRLLYTIREYSQQRLAGRSDDPTKSELQAWAVGVARFHGRVVDVADELAALTVLDAEHPNLVAALQAGLEVGDGAAVGGIASALAPYWDLRGMDREGAMWIDKALALLPPDDDIARGPCLIAASALVPASDFQGRKRFAEKALVVADRIGDDVLASRALATIGHVEVETDNVESARRHLEAALERAEAAGDTPGIALASERLSFMPGWVGNPNGPQPILLRAHALYQALGNRRGQLWCLAQMGYDYVALTEMQRGIDAYAEGLRLAQELRYPQGEAWLLDALAETSLATGNAAEARARFADAEEIQRRLGDHVNRGWSLGGLVKTHRLLGQFDGAVRWLQEFVAFLRQDLAPASYRRPLLLEAAEVALVGGDWTAVSWVVGALFALPPGKAIAVDDQLYRLMEAQARAAIGDAAVEDAKRWGGTTPPVDVAQRVIDLVIGRANT